MSVRTVPLLVNVHFPLPDVFLTWLRAKMNQERFNSVAVLNTHRTDKNRYYLTTLFVTKIDFTAAVHLLGEDVGKKPYFSLKVRENV